MPATTPNYDLPYPVGSDPVRDGENIIQALAEAIDSYLTYVGEVSGLTGEDDAVALLIDSPFSDTAQALQARYATPRHKTAVDFDIPLDGITDATAALNAIGPGQGEVVLRGDFMVLGPVTVGSGTTLRGTGPRNAPSGARIYAGPGFSGAHLINLGGGGTAHGSRVEHMHLDCAGLVATGVKGEDIQELSGLRDVLLSGFTALGVDLTGSGTSQNYVLEGLEIYAEAAATNIMGIKTEPGAFVQSLRDITVILAPLQGAAGAGSIGLQLNGPVGLASALHFESTVVGVQVNGATGSTIAGVSGVGGTGIVTDLVQIVNSAQDNITILGLFPNGSTRSLNDLLHAYTYASALGFYSWGGGGVGLDPILSTAPTMPLRATGIQVLRSAAGLSAMRFLNAAGTEVGMINAYNDGEMYYDNTSSGKHTFRDNTLATRFRVEANGVFVPNRAAVPGTPTGGGMLYVESGALKYKGSGGTVTTIAPA